ncbi:MAG: zinc metalloprotease HtpX, partial [Halobacteriales archaeon]|nr:zinc metalloprotease HtpX [Halobacteriales archaeon]
MAPGENMVDNLRGTLRTFALFVALAFLFMVIGTVLGEFVLGTAAGGALIFLVLALVMNFVSYFWSDKIVLWSYRAKVISPAEAPRLHAIVDRVCANAQLPKPRVAVIPTDTPNAFATGRNQDHAVVAATRGILNLLDDDELEAVLSHEMAHVKNRDVLVGSVAATIAMAIAFPVRWLFWGTMFGGGRRDSGNILVVLAVGVLAAMAAFLIRMAISRSREYGADRTGAEICRKPYALASALQKLDAMNRRIPMQVGNPATSSLFIVNPFRGQSLVSLFS